MQVSKQENLELLHINHAQHAVTRKFKFVVKDGG